MMIARRLAQHAPAQTLCRAFSTTRVRLEIRDVSELPDRIIPTYKESRATDLLSLQWPAPPRNILMVKKSGAEDVTQSLLEYAKHVNADYENVSIILEPSVARALHSTIPFPVYTISESSKSLLPQKTDLVTTLGGDGTILHASSLFSTTKHVPPILSFSMGTLGFLGEWKFAEYKRAFREIYMSGASGGSPLLEPQNEKDGSDSANVPGWSSIRGKAMGPLRGSKVLLRNRLRVGVLDAEGQRLTSKNMKESAYGDIHAMNEVVIHRGASPHLVFVEVFIGGRYVTEAVADGIIISTPTGSTAYSLSSGGGIIHPSVSALQLTPICPRSLSFRPLVLPANTQFKLRLSEKNRGRALEISVDGKMMSGSVGVGMEIVVEGEAVDKTDGEWTGGVPCVVRGAKAGLDDDDGWVGGLNGLLKFNYPFGEE